MLEIQCRYNWHAKCILRNKWLQTGHVTSKMLKTTAAVNCIRLWNYRLSIFSHSALFGGFIFVGGSNQHIPRNRSKQSWQRTEMSLTSILCVLIFHAFQYSTCFRVSVTSSIIWTHLFLLPAIFYSPFQLSNQILSLLMLTYLLGTKVLLSTIKFAARNSNKTYALFLMICCFHYIN